MVAVPGAFCPIPFTLVGIAVLVLVLGSQLAAMVFVSVFFAFVTLCGSGIIQRITRRGAERAADQEHRQAEAESQRLKAMEAKVESLVEENKLLRRMSNENYGVRVDDINDIFGPRRFFQPPTRSTSRSMPTLPPVTANVGFDDNAHGGSGGS